MVHWKRWLVAAALVGAVGCGESETDDGTGLNGEGDAQVEPNGDAGANPALDAGTGATDASVGVLIDARVTDPGPVLPQVDAGEAPSCTGLKARIRDFKAFKKAQDAGHADFETFSGENVTPGLVGPELVDNLPQYTGICDASKTYPNGACPYKQQMSTAASFSQWYAKDDIPGVSQSITIELPLTEIGRDSYEYKNLAFFPIDGMGFGNEGKDEAGKDHNFHFTTEVRTSFTYRAGDKFTFSGDDDLWIFVNGKLALDLGGLHPPKERTIDFDAQKDALGIEVGKTYRMDIFHAERHTKQSNFWIRTNIECFVDVPIYL